MSVDLSTYYQNLLITQYHEKPKAKAEIALGAKTFTGDWLMTDIPNIVDVDTAEGTQLDLIGKIVGLPRIANGFVYGENYYSYDNESSPMAHPEQKGMSDVGNPVGAKFKDYETIRKSIYTMSDGLYRKMIKLKILYNNTKATLKDIDEGLFKIFGNSVTITDNFDMTGRITVEANATEMGSLAFFLHLFPRPLGVNYDIIYL